MNYVKNLTIKEKRQQKYLQSIEGLLHHTGLSFHERESRLAFLGMSSQKKFLVIIADNNSSSDSKALHHFDDRLTLHLYGKVKLIKFRIQENRIAVIIEGSARDMEKDLYHRLTTLFTPDFGICVGISELVDPALNFPKAYTQADDALEMGKHLYTEQEKNIFSHMELGIHRTLYNLQKKDSLGKLYESQAQKMARY
ncbi:hypothetical protein RWE15_09195 [Virgibacillus halophilus]|uniref:CdaR GGDEF-like domain-containing protein n=1 Tax=Tigheibacillus halophilus TaxID=361280 RepID=A0ABU5C5I3_9BACI|nr:hypothetical protein [Virgibacillus halophilus]